MTRKYVNTESEIRRLSSTFKFHTFFGLDLDIEDLTKIPIDAIVQILNPTGKVYANGNHTFFCQASSFISNGEFHWKLRAPNGTEFPSSEDNKEPFEIFLFWKFEKSLGKTVYLLPLLPRYTRRHGGAWLCNRKWFNLGSQHDFHGTNARAGSDLPRPNLEHPGWVALEFDHNWRR